MKAILQLKETYIVNFTTISWYKCSWGYLDWVDKKDEILVEFFW